MNTLQRINRSMLAMAAIAVSTSAVASAQYDYTKINIPKSIFTQATGISNKGEIVGVYALVPDHVTQILGFWRTNDIPAIWQYPLTDPKAEQDTWVSAIDSGRIIVGNYDNLSGDNVGMFLNGGTYSDFGVTGCQSTFVNGINDRGETAGNCQTPMSDPLGWIRTRTGGLVTFGVPGATETYANAINQARSVVGSYVTSSVSHGYLRDVDGNVTSIDFPGATATYANGISDTGVIVGSFQDSAMNDHGFMYSAGAFLQLDVPGSSRTIVNGINRHGRFVGRYDTRKTGRTYGFLATPCPVACIQASDDLLN